MKKLVIILMSVMAMAAHADEISMDVGQTKALPSCGGLLKTSVVDNDLKLKFAGVKECSNFSIVSGGSVLNDYDRTKLDGENQNRSGTFYISTDLFGLGWKSVTVKVNSNSGRHGDEITVYYRVSYAPKKTKLESCGGTVKVTQTYDQLNLTFDGVEKCSNFDIINADGELVDDYTAKKLQGENGSRYGSFTIPRRYMGYGFSTIRVVVKSNSGKHQDTITVIYFN